jgi:transcriptional regulator with XRE-family HTH domain
MQSEELKVKLKSLRVSQVKFAVQCGVSEVQVSKWANGHSDVPEYANTILKLIEENKEKSSIEKLTNLANVVSDGHFTLCKFTTNYRVGLGTPSERASIDKMAEGKTVSEAIDNLLSKVQGATSIY